MATKRDYYEVLGVSKNTSDSEIKSAYRRLARKHHPDVDKSAGSAEKFKEISEAYQVLADANKKKTYDQFGHAAFSRDAGFGGQGRPFGGGWQQYSWSSSGGGPFGSAQGGPNVQFDFGGFEDPFELFEQIFGGGSPFGQAFKRRPTYQLELSFDEAVHGATKTVEYTDSAGKRQRLSIKVPSGVDSGTRMRFGPSADGLDIIFRVSPHPEFIREGSDIFSEINLTIPQLVLGDTIEVSTVDGKLRLKIPSGAEPGSLIKIKGKGIKDLRGARGDHYVRVKLEVPKRLSNEERSLYEKLAQLKLKQKGWF